MGYGYYELPTPEGKMMKRGYCVRCKCHKRGCKEQIDRGLAYLCYNCTRYFCGKHLTMALTENDEPLVADCFAGRSGQVCLACAELMERQGGGIMTIIITCTTCGAVLDEVEAPGVEGTFGGGLCAECRERHLGEGSEEGEVPF